MSLLGHKAATAPLLSRLIRLGLGREHRDSRMKIWGCEFPLLAWSPLVVQTGGPLLPTTRLEPSSGSMCFLQHNRSKRDNGGVATLHDEDTRWRNCGRPQDGALSIDVIVI